MQAKKSQTDRNVKQDCPMHGGKEQTHRKNLKLANNHQSKTEKVQPKPIEDVLGVENYSLQNCVRFIDRNPDMMNTPIVTCACGELIDRRKDWYVMIANGILLCWGCATCNSCMRSNPVLQRRLVCIDGLVLCHSCLTNFGYFVEPTFRMIIEPSNKAKPLDNPETTDTAGKSEQSSKTENPEKQPNNSEKNLEEQPSYSENPNNTDPKDVPEQVELVDRLHSDSNNSNNAAKSPASEKGPGSKVSDVLREYKRKDRRMYVPKTDHRRPFRPILYDRPSVRLPDDRNPLLTAPVYDAYKGALEKMVCPVCNKAARGSAKYVVPSVARIYHRKCFTCKSCQTLMCEGIQIAGKHFEFCSCEPPRVWCTKKACRKQRMAHHESSACWLGPQRPGGRVQMDTDITTQLKKAAADKKAQLSMSASKTIEASED